MPTSSCLAQTRLLPRLLPCLLPCLLPLLSACADPADVALCEDVVALDVQVEGACAEGTPPPAPPVDPCAAPSYSDEEAAEIEACLDDATAARAAILTADEEEVASLCTTYELLRVRCFQLAGS